MRKYIMPIVAVIALGMATPAMAYDAGGLLSMQEALDVAANTGLTTISHTQFAGDIWRWQSMPPPVMCFGSTGSRATSSRRLLELGLLWRPSSDCQRVFINTGR